MQQMSAPKTTKNRGPVLITMPPELAKKAMHATNAAIPKITRAGENQLLPCVMAGLSFPKLLFVLNLAWRLSTRKKERLADFPRATLCKRVVQREELDVHALMDIRAAIAVRRAGRAAIGRGDIVHDVAVIDRTSDRGADRSEDDSVAEAASDRIEHRRERAGAGGAVDDRKRGHARGQDRGHPGVVTEAVPEGACFDGVAIVVSNETADAIAPHTCAACYETAGERAEDDEQHGAGVHQLNAAGVGKESDTRDESRDSEDHPCG